MSQIFIKNNFLTLTLLSLLSACGGGSSSSDNSSNVTTIVPAEETVIPEVNVIPSEPIPTIIPGDSIPPVIENTTFTGLASFSGIITYTNYPVSESLGIDYNSEELRAVSGVVIQLQDISGNILDESNTASDGSYSLSGNVDGFARILVRAELGENGDINTRVIDNTNNNALYALFSDINVTSASTIQNINATSGWDGTSYSGTRAAAPFSILDVIYQAQKFVETVDSDLSFPLLRVNWSTLNNTSTGSRSDGDISSSFYSDNQLFILGDENSDTDEYDKAVLAHEWGHYFEDNFSRSDSVGGPHGLADVLHPSVSWSEGFATAIAAMVLNDPRYVDTSGIMQRNAFELNAENNRFGNNAFLLLGDQPRVDGYYSEQSVTQIVYDVFDDGSINNTNTDDDNLALGFAPIYEVLTNGVRNTRSFTSIFAFLHFLRIESSNNIDAINSIGNGENIDMENITEFDDPTDTALVPIYTDISANSTITVDIRGDDLQTFDTYGDITDVDAGNKLLNQRFFKATAGDAGCYVVIVTPIPPTTTANVRITFTNRIRIDSLVLGREAGAGNFSTGEIFTFNVDAFTNNASFNVTFESSAIACF